MILTLIKRSRLARDARGASVIEFAAVAPFIGFLILGASDYATGFSQKLALEQAAGRTIEKATALGATGSSYDLLRAEAANASGQPIENVTVDKWLECNGARQQTFDGACSNGQQIGRYVSVRIRATYTPQFDYSIFSRMFGGSAMQATIPIQGDARVRVQ